MLCLLSVVLTVVAQFLTWNVDFSGEVWNAWDQLAVNIHAKRFYGWLMLASLIVANLSALTLAALALVSNRSVAGRGPAIGALWATVLGLVATFGMVAGYVVLGATRETGPGTWLYGVAFLPALLGVFLRRRLIRPQPGPPPPPRR